MNVSVPIAAASRQLQDITNVAFPTATLLTYLNYAVREIIDVKPEAGSTSGLITLVAGSRQSLPAGWNLLINAKRNMGANGTTPGRAITQIPRETLDQALPDWQTWPTADEVRHVITDDRDPLFFDVFPPQPATPTQKIEAIGSVYPAKVTDPANGTFPIPDQYEVPCVKLIIAWALAESTTVPNALNKSTMFRRDAYQGLGVKQQAEAKVYSEGQ